MNYKPAGGKREINCGFELALAVGIYEPLSKNYLQ